MNKTPPQEGKDFRVEHSVPFTAMLTLSRVRGWADLDNNTYDTDKIEAWLQQTATTLDDKMLAVVRDLLSDDREVRSCQKDGCGEPFFVTRGHARFCSDYCRYLHKTKDKA